MSMEFDDKFVDFQDILNTLGLAVIRNMLGRTRKGVDVEGISFDAYNKQYAKRRKRKTGFPETPVNLTATKQREQRMMSTDNIIHEINGDYNSVEVFMKYPEKEQLAYFHHVSGAGKGRVIRRFFDVGEDEFVKLVELVDEYIDKNIGPATAEEIVRLVKTLAPTDVSGNYTNI